MFPRPSRPRRRRVDVIDVGFRVCGTLGGLGLAGFVVAIMATSETRGLGWLIASIVVVVPMAAAFVFAMLSWVSLRADRRMERARRMDMDFAPVRARVRPVSDE